MEPLRLPIDEEIGAAYDQGKEAVIELFHQTLVKLVERIQLLEDQIAKDSGNSSKPPSRDGLKKKPKSLRQKNGKKSGVQPGHSGHTLKGVAHAGHIEVHRVNRCCICQTNLEDGGGRDVEKRQVFDLPPRKGEVTEHQVEIEISPEFQHTTVGKFPGGVTQSEQYGERIKAQMVYFHLYQLVPLERAAEIVEDLYGQTVSEGTIVEACNETAQQVEPIYQLIKAELTNTTDTGHFDETGCRFEAKLW